MSALTIRPPEEDEVAAVAELFNEVSNAAYGEGDTTEDDVRIWFTSPGVDRMRDIRVGVDPAGALVAYADVSEEGGKAWFDVREHPSVGDGSAAKQVFEALLPRVRELASGPPVLRSWVSSAEESVRAMWEREGFTLIRHSYRMSADLDGARPAPRWPRGIAVRTFEPGRDERTVYDVQNEGFADMWEYEPDPFEEWLHFMTGVQDFDPTLWFLAVEGTEVAGVCLCRPEGPGQPDAGWVRVLAVRPRWRRRGIGLALLEHAFREFQARGRLRAGLGVDAASETGALELYERAGMRVVRRGDIYEKALRAP